MTGHLSPADEEGSQVAIEGPVSVYRDPDRDDEVVAATDGQEVPLGIMDVTVSRMDDGSAPVVVEPASDGVEIRNVHNENGVRVDVGIEERTVQEGSATRISDDATVDIGFDATLEVSFS
jgi:hypothetical protein